MPFCKFCGKEVSEGSICECRKRAMRIDYRKGLDSQDIKKTAYENKRQLIIGAVCIAVMIFAVIGIISFIFSGHTEEPVVRTTGREYEKPVTDFVSAYNKNNSERMMKAMLPSDYISKIKKESGSFENWSDFTDGLDEIIESEKDSLEDDYGKNVAMSVEFLDKKNVKHSEMEKLEKLYTESFGTDGIRTAYKVKIELELSGLDDSESDKYWVYVVEVRGEGWLLSPENDELNLGTYIGYEPYKARPEPKEEESKESSGGNSNKGQKTV